MTYKVFITIFVVVLLLILIVIGVNVMGFFDLLLNNR